MKKLVEALIKAQSEMTSAVATGTNPHFKSEYAPLDEVIKAVKKPLNSNGIFFLQKVYVADNGQCVETEFYGHDAVMKCGKVFVKCDKATSQGYGSSLSYAKDTVYKQRVDYLLVTMTMQTLVPMKLNQ